MVNSNGANLGFETQLWVAADKMRGHMDAGEYKHVVPGYEDGMDDVTGTEEVFVMPDAHKDHWYYGIHDRLIKDEPGTEKVIGLKTTRRYGDDGQ